MISLTTADSALKNVYLEVITDQLQNSVDPFYAKIKKSTQNIEGNEVKKMVPVGVNGGIGAGTEIGALPSAKDNKYITFTSKLKNLYGTIQISDKALRASRGEAGAFVNLLNAEMENLIESSKFNFRRMLHSDGTGLIGSLYGFEMDSAKTESFDIGKFAVGMRCELSDETNTPLPQYNDMKIVNIDYGKNTIYFDKPLTGEETLGLDIFVYLRGAKDKEFVGLEGICNPNITNLYGIDRTNYPYLNGNRFDFKINQFNVLAIMEAIDEMRINYNSNIDFITSGFEFRRLLQDKLKENNINTDVLNLEGGFKSISFNGIPVVASRFVNQLSCFMLDSSVFHLHQLCDWTWLTNNNGQILSQREGYPIHTATLVKYCDLICDKPNSVLCSKIV